MKYKEKESKRESARRPRGGRKRGKVGGWQSLENWGVVVEKRGAGGIKLQKGMRGKGAVEPEGDGNT